MKKSLFFIILLVLPFFVNAECTYSEKYELNALSSYIDSSYQYNEETGLFTVRLVNVDDRLEIRYESTVLNAEDGIVLLDNIEPGSRLSLDVYSTIYNECYNEYLRVVYISVPYYNRFYGSILCEGHEHLDICNSKFLDYQISNETFILILNNEDFTLEKEEQSPTISGNSKWYEEFIVVLQDYYLKIIISIVTTILTVSICNVIYRKVKHKL